MDQREKAVKDAVAAEAQRKAQDKAVLEHIGAATERLYGLRCFETMALPDGSPLAMRVPGGWIFYYRSGGGGLKLQVGDGEEEEQLMGSTYPTVNQVFVPYSDEFMNGPESIMTTIAGMRQ